MAYKKKKKEDREPLNPERAERLLYEIRNGLAFTKDATLRGSEIAQLYAQGFSLEEIGQNYGVTRERIRQIIVESCTYSSKEIKAALKFQEEAETEKQRTYDAARALLWYQSHHYGSLELGCEDLGFDLPYFKSLLEERGVSYISPRQVKTSRQEFTDEEILDLLQRFHEETGEVTGDAFEEWSKRHRGPSKQLPALRFGKWSLALQKAGIGGVEETQRKTTFTPEDCWSVAIDYLRTLPEAPSYADFSSWLEAHPNMPSSATVRNKLKLPWSKVMRKAGLIVDGLTENFDEVWLAEVLRPRDWAKIREEANATTYDPVELVREAFEEVGFPLTMAAYNKWAIERNKPVAALLTRASNLCWNKLLRKAKIPQSSLQRKTEAQNERKNARKVAGA